VHCCGRWDVGLLVLMELVVSVVLILLILMKLLQKDKEVMNSNEKEATHFLLEADNIMVENVTN
jgi:hypothetical protein